MIAMQLTNREIDQASQAILTAEAFSSIDYERMVEHTSRLDRVNLAAKEAFVLKMDNPHVDVIRGVMRNLRLGYTVNGRSL